LFSLRDPASHGVFLCVRKPQTVQATQTWVYERYLVKALTSMCVERAMFCRVSYQKWRMRGLRRIARSGLTSQLGTSANMTSSFLHSENRFPERLGYRCLLEHVTYVLNVASLLASKGNVRAKKKRNLSCWYGILSRRNKVQMSALLKVNTSMVLWNRPRPLQFKFLFIAHFHFHFSFDAIL
jgi:hypothetical protein